MEDRSSEMQLSAKQLKVWIIRTAKFCIFCWCMLGLESAIENRFGESPSSLETSEEVTSSIPSRSTANAGDDRKPITNYRFRFSLEPGSNKRRIPDRFWKNSTRENEDNVWFATLPSRPSCTSDLGLLVLVKSAVGNVAQREAIRKTWGRARHIASCKVRILYILGQPNTGLSERVEDYLKEEPAKYDDVVVGDFVDAYTNVTIKSLTGLRFVFEFCRAVEFVLNVDDDVFANLPDMITKHFSFVRPAQNVLQCGLQTVKFAKVTRRGKWAVKYEKYNRIYYPPYCKGPCFLMSGDVALALYEISLVTPSDIPIDDAFITGILREKIGIELSSIRKGLCTHLENPYNVPGKMFRFWNNTL